MFKKIHGGTPDALLYMAMANLSILFFLGGAEVEAGLRLTAMSLIGCLNLSLCFYFRSWTRLGQTPIQFQLLMILIIVYPLIQLIPLPWSIWSKLPGRELEVSVLNFTELSGSWHSLTNSWISTGLFLVIVNILIPLYISVISFSREQVIKFLYCALICILVSAIIGVVQVSSGGQYFSFYTTQHRGFLIGTFANRNHMALAVVLAFSIGSFLNYLQVNRENGIRLLNLLILAAISLSIVMATGSRSGLLLLLMSIVCAFFSVAPGFFHQNKKMFAIIVPTLSLLFIAAYNYSTVTRKIFARFLVIDDDNRFYMWPISWEALKEYFPIGSGSGTFVNVYKKFETLDVLSSRYANHAHQDFIEFAIEGGILAIIIMLMAICTWFFCTKLLFRHLKNSDRAFVVRHIFDIQAALIGSWIVFIVILHSMVDYPLRRPAISAIFVVAFGLMARFFVNQTGKNDASISH